MGEIRSFFDSFKEFIWDIIGYFVPGMFFLIILSVSINTKYFINIPSTFPNSDGFIIAIVAYVIGYIIYGFSDMKENVMGQKSYSKTILENVSKIEAYGKAKEILIERYSEDSTFADKLNRMSVREVRNIVMGFIPSSDQKIYTFMFRSEISRHVGNICLVIGIIGFLSFVFSCAIPSYDLFQVSTQHIILYISMIVSYVFLREPRNKFYRIAITLPFNLLIAEHKNDKG